jgi:hypothetical protein
MLTPRKHLNLDASVLRIASLMLRELRRRGVMEFERLRRVVINRVGADADMSFLPALSFLHLIGRVDYHLQNDTVEYRTEPDAMAYSRSAGYTLTDPRSLLRSSSTMLRRPTA